MPTTFHVRRDQLATTRIVQSDATPLAAGEVRVAVDRFAYTANNITYAAFGEAMHYWQFYPVPSDADGTAWGCIPVWGYASVVQSLHPGVAVGERLYGYWPMATQAVLQPVRLSMASFVEGAAHRAALPGVYNHVQRCSADPGYSPGTEGLQALLRPLHATAWLIDDFLADQDFFGTTADGARGTMLLSSASSKTAWATAERLAHRAGVEVVGLTSPAHVDYCRSLGVYHRVLAYGELDTLPADLPCVYVDFAGHGALRRDVHTRFHRLAYSCSVGGTHVEHLAGAGGLPGPRPVLFFAPAQIRKRAGDWGGEVLDQRLAAGWRELLARVTDARAPWLVVEEHRGPAAVQAAHATLLGGRVDPRQGLVLSLAD